ncbi:MAG TPA: cytochrome c oxidase subunit II [Gammaproteobacteria bacterium]|nr:cytochrome c oxidase subunit II [Gammaproteobacteria bacterium]
MTNAHADYTLNLTPGVTPISQDIYNLHMTIFWICVAIGVVVFSIMFYALIRHRKSLGVKPATFHGNTRIEIFWAVVPFLILVIMAVPATLVLMRMEDSSNADVNIKVTGYQWKWQYEYLDEGISFYSNLSTPLDQIKNKAPKDKWYLLQVDKPLVVPVHKKIRFLVTSNDVIHSWWVPALGIKRDAIPGFIHEAWARIETPGIYRGQCAELCGLNHGFMPIVVDARSEEDYAKWVQAQKSGAAEAQTQAVADNNKTWTQQELMQSGENLYNSQCAACHKPNGLGMPPAFPALVGSKIATGPVKNHIDIVLNGKPGTAMAAFGKQLNDADIAAIITYERNAWGNAEQNKYGKHAGGLVQPAEVAAARQTMSGETK